MLARIRFPCPIDGAAAGNKPARTDLLQSTAETTRMPDTAPPAPLPTDAPPLDPVPHAAPDAVPGAASGTTGDIVPAAALDTPSSWRADLVAATLFLTRVHLAR